MPPLPPATHLHLAAPLGTGWPELDRALGGGVPPADLVEITSERAGQGELTLALALAQRLDLAPLLLIDLEDDLLLPTARWPHDAVRLRPRSLAEALEVTERALRCAGVGAAVACLEDAALRRAQQVRLRQAARAGQTLALLLRRSRGGERASAAPVRLRVARLACPGRRERLAVTVERARGFVGAGAAVQVEV